MPAQRDFDLILYGATGYTGQLVAEYLYQQYGVNKTLTWAIAGRNIDKLTTVRSALGIGTELPLIVADPGQPDTLTAMAERSRLIITTVGPYQLYGSELLAACARCGTDYVDLCGEPGWMAEMIQQHQQQAQQSGARLVFSCGFDSIPFDLGVYFLQQAARQQLGHPVSRVKGRVRSLQGTFSGGTVASFKATMQAAAQQPDILATLNNPFALTPGFTGAEQPWLTGIDYDDSVSSWIAPFIMATINTKTIHRSNWLLGHHYGKDFVYDELMMTGDGEAGEALAKAIAADRSMETNPRQPGEGPSQAEREAGSYDIVFVADTGQGTTLCASVQGDRDPGYGSTCKMIAESALCLLHHPGLAGGGIWTPAAAMGETLINRLQQYAGLSFQLE